MHVWGPPSTTLHLRDRLARYLSPPLFPVQMRDLPSRLTLHDVPLSDFEIEAIGVRASLVCHPGPTVGYRISENGKAVVYLPDHEPALGARPFPEDAAWTSGFELAEEADLLIHDAQYTSEEYEEHVGWGHSCVDDTVDVAMQAGIGHLFLFHHDPDHDDAHVSKMLAGARQQAARPSAR